MEPVPSNYNMESSQGSLDTEPEAKSFLQKYGDQRPEESGLWKRIHKESAEGGSAFKNFVKVGAGFGTGIAYSAVILPVSLVLLTINAAALGALGIARIVVSPSDNASAKVDSAMDRLTGSLLDIIYLNGIILKSYQAFEPSPIARSDNYKGRPVILGLHGLFDNKTRMQHLVSWLKKGDTPLNSEEAPPDGITPGDFYLPNYGKPVTTEKIDEYALDIALKLAQIREDRGYKPGEKMPVIIDAHSMGGLVAVRLMHKYAKEAELEIIGIVANGTPWEGSPIAPLGSLISECSQEMELESDFMKSLKKSAESNSSSEDSNPSEDSSDSSDQLTEEQKKVIYTIASKGDTLVPFSSAKAANLNFYGEDSANKPKVTKVAEGHLSMLYASDVKNENIKCINKLWNDWD